jgi:CBS domain-containing protein
MSHKKLGMTTVLDQDPTTLLGMISDGDLRRLFERDGHMALAHTAAEIMNPHPVTIPPDAFAAEALALMDRVRRKITSPRRRENIVASKNHPRRCLAIQPSASSTSTTSGVLGLQVEAEDIGQ